MSTAGRIIKNTGWLYAKMGITMFISLWTTRLILNSLGASDFGIFNIVGGAIGMMGFLNAAMAAATQRFMSYVEGEGDNEKKKAVFNVSIVLHLAVAAMVAVLLILAGVIFFKHLLNIPPERIDAARIIYSSLIVSTIFTIMTVPYDAVLNAHENMKYYAVVGILESFLKLAVAFACVRTSSDKLIVYGILMAGIPLVTMTIMRVYCRRNYEECVFKPQAYCSLPLAKEMAGFAGWNFLGTFSGLIGNQGLGLVANHFFGTLINAAIGVTTQLQGQIQALTTNMQKALNPVIVKSEGANERETMIAWSLRGCKYSYILMAIIAVPLCIDADYALALWLKDVPEWTKILFILQMVRTLLEMTTGSLNTSLSAAGNIKALNIQATVLLLSPLAIVWVLFELGFQPYWIYLTMIASVVLQNIFKLQLCKKHCGLSYSRYAKEVMLPVLACTAFMVSAGTLPRLLLESGFIRLVLICLACWAGTGLSFLTKAVLDEQERGWIKNLVSSVINKINNKA